MQNVLGFRHLELWFVKGIWPWENKCDKGGVTTCWRRLYLADKQLKLLGNMDHFGELTECLSKPTRCCSTKPCLSRVLLLMNNVLWGSANPEQTYLTIPMDTLLHWQKWLSVVTLWSVSETSTFYAIWSMHCDKWARCWWLTPVILANMETEIRRTEVWS
jgi:hypothetical protein